MEDIEWRYQTVVLNIAGRQYFNVYEVGVDTRTGKIIHVVDPEPVQLAGESIDELMSMLHNIQHSIKTYGVLTERVVQDSIQSTEITPDISEPEEDEDEDITDREYEDEDYIEMMDQEWDDQGNVIDLVDFMNRRK